MIGRTIYRNPSGKAGARADCQEPTGVAGNTPAAIRSNPYGQTLRKTPVPEPANGSTYGTAFQSGPFRLAATVPSEPAAVSLSDNGPLGVGVMHEAGSPELLVSKAGDYFIEFMLCVTSDSAKQATFALQTNRSNIPGGVWDVPLRSGYQAVTGFAMTHLQDSSRVRIVMIASSPLEVTLAGSGTTAALSVRKL